MTAQEPKQIAILIPCYNEEITIGSVIDSFHIELPEALIYVYDNNSTDNTARIAQEHGAIVRFEPRQGKGNVIRQMLRDINADYYVLVDGDGQHPPETVHELLKPLQENYADIVIGDRLTNQSYRRENKRIFHLFGNNTVRLLIGFLYNTRISDALTGYRAMNRHFAKTLPILSKGFEIEVEMYIHAVDKNWRIVEVPIETRSRPEGSISKLSTIRDGLKVLAAILSLFKDYRPLVLFTFIGSVLVLAGILFGVPVILEFFQTSLVERFPTAILAVGLVLSGLLSLTCGIVSDTVVKSYRKQYELEVFKESRDAQKEQTK